MKTYIHIRTSAVKGQIPRPTHMTFKHNAVPSITWRRISVCNTFEGHFLRIMLSGESQPPKVTSCWPIYITELQRFRASEQIREPEPGVKKGVTSYNSHVMELLYLRWPTGPTVINWTELNTHTPGLQAFEHKHFNGLKWDFLLRDYLQFNAHFFLCPTHDPFRRHKIMKDITRSSVNISSKDQEKFKVFSQGNQRDNWYEGADRGQRNLGRRTRVKDQGDEQVGEKKQTAQTDPVRRPRTNAGFGVI